MIYQSHIELIKARRTELFKRLESKLNISDSQENVDTLTVFESLILTNSTKEEAMNLLKYLALYKIGSKETTRLAGRLSASYGVNLLEHIEPVHMRRILKGYHNSLKAYIPTPVIQKLESARQRTKNILEVAVSENISGYYVIMYLAHTMKSSEREIITQLEETITPSNWKIVGRFIREYDLAVVKSIKSRNIIEIQECLNNAQIIEMMFSTDYAVSEILKQTE